MLHGVGVEVGAITNIHSGQANLKKTKAKAHATLGGFGGLFLVAVVVDLFVALLCLV